MPSRRFAGSQTLQETLSLSWQDYLDAQGPADKSIVFAIAWYTGMAVPGISGGTGDTNWYDGNINDAVATFVAAHPERLISFMARHPHDAGCMDELERCHTDLGMRGIKLGANNQNFDPLEARALAIYEQAQRLGCRLCFIRARRQCVRRRSGCRTRC